MTHQTLHVSARYFSLATVHPTKGTLKPVIAHGCGFDWTTGAMDRHAQTLNEVRGLNDLMGLQTPVV